MKKSIFNIIILVTSLTALVFSLLKITPFSVNGDTYIGIIATFIGISVTLLIGFQIINYFEIRKELTELKQSKKEIFETQKRISIIEHEMQESLDVISAKFTSFEQDKCVEAFLIQQNALISSLRAERKEYKNIFRGLKEYITIMQPGYFATGTKTQIEEKIADYIQRSEEIDSQLKKLENYYCIKYEYEHIMKCFYSRLDNAKQYKAVSQKEREEILR